MVKCDDCPNGAVGEIWNAKEKPDPVKVATVCRECGLRRTETPGMYYRPLPRGDE